MAGKLPPDTEKPVPEIESELTVTATLPLEVTVTGLVTAELTVTLPKESEVALRLNAGVAAFSCSEAACDVLPVVAVSETDCAVLTEATLAVKVTLVDPEGTVTEPGTVTALLLLARPTLMPPVGAAELSVTVHDVVPAPVNEVVPQATALTVGTTAAPVPLRETETAGALLEMVNCPVAELADVGSN